MSRKYYYIPLHIVFILMLLFCIFGYRLVFFNDAKSSHVREGHVNLSSMNYKDNFIVALDGEWASSNAKDSYAVFPDTLSDQQSEKNTYTIDISLPRPKAYYSLIMPRTYSEFKILINGNEIYDTTASRENGSSVDHLRLITFYSYDTDITISIIPYNHLAVTGAPQSVVIGSLDAAARSYIRQLSIDVLFFIIDFCAAIYFLVLSTREKKHHVYLSFSFVCFICSLRTLLLNTMLFGILFPYLNPDFVYHFLTELVPLLTFSLLIYNAEQFSEIMPWKYYRICMIFTLINMIVIPFIAHDNPKLLNILCVINIILVLILIIHLALILIKNRDISALPFSMSIIIITICATFELANSDISLFYGYELSCGFIFFIIVQIILFIVRLKYAYEEELALSISYQNSLKNLEHEETNFLSSHLKAHFLFNSLNIISGYALFEPEIAKKITDALITYLKQLFEHDTLNEMNTLKNEIDLVKAFGYIESERFPDIEFYYDIPEIIPDIEIPSLILQPLLENAVNHGIRKKAAGSHGRILLSVRAGRYFVEFNIKDDGIGFPPEEIKKALQKPTDGKYHSLYHLQNLLKELYNENLLIRSVSGIGTVITFKIPITNTLS